MRLHFGRRFMVAAVVFIVSAVLFSVSFFQENAEVFLFPMIVASTMLAMTTTSLFRELFELCVDDFQPFPFIRIMPVLVMMAGGANLIEWLGMYTTAFIVLLAVTLWYSPEEDYKGRLTQSFAFTVGFTAFMYFLFTIVLNVQLPRGVLI